MKRELKFKAWHIEQKQMYWFDLMWGNHGKGDGYIGMVEWDMPRDSPSSYSGNQTLIDPHNCEIMQYTGFPDINGKEIHEGDIMDYGNGRVFYVSYVGGQFVAAFNKRVINSMTPIYNYKVIGNIYENPELLETKKDQLSERKAE